jgi:hypothetical protein
VAVALTTAVDAALETGLALDEQMTDAARRTYEKARQAELRSYMLKAFEKATADNLTQFTASML